jgi:histidine triad (HIT) family protein
MTGGAETMSDTIFDKIIRREIPADILYEDDEVLAFSYVNPQAPVHFLVIPKQRIPTINDITPEQAALVGKLVLVAQRLAADKGVAEDGYRLVMNCNEYGGQTVFHIHLHVLGGRPMGWPPG